MSSSASFVIKRRIIEKHSITRSLISFSYFSLLDQHVAGIFFLCHLAICLSHFPKHQSFAVTTRKSLIKYLCILISFFVTITLRVSSFEVSVTSAPFPTPNYEVSRCLWGRYVQTFTHTIPTGVDSCHPYACINLSSTPLYYFRPTFMKRTKCTQRLGCLCCKSSTIHWRNNKL